MYCANCGNEIQNGANVCPNCGLEVHPQAQPQTQANYSQPPVQPVQPVNVYAQQPVNPANVDAKSTGFAVLCFFFPVIGLILYLVWKDTKPLKAKSCGKGALIGLITSVVLWIICFVIAILAGVVGASTANFSYEYFISPFITSAF